MSEKDQDQNNVSPENFSPLPSGGSTQAVNSIGMSPMERIANIKAMQKLSPFSAIDNALKKLDLNSFGLGKKLFEESMEKREKIVGKINTIRQNEKEYNYHIPGLTKNIGGQEVVVTNVSDYNTKLRNTHELIEKDQKGGFVATDWAPKLKKGILNQRTDHPEKPGTLK